VITAVPPNKFRKNPPGRNNFITNSSPPKNIAAYTEYSGGSQEIEHVAAKSVAPGTQPRLAINPDNTVSIAVIVPMLLVNLLVQSIFHSLSKIRVPHGGQFSGILRPW
jgi:hypothetical protein